MSKVSIIIPARNEKYLQMTVDDLYKTTFGDFEIIVYLDGHSIYPRPVEHIPGTLKVIQTEKALGLKTALNILAATATGKYMLKLDAHVIMIPGWDEILKADCERDWLSVPSKYYLNPETKARRYSAINYLYMQYPYTVENRFGNALFPRLWNRKSKKLIDDLMTITGCCWFVHRDKFIELGGLNLKDSTTLSPESEELPLKYWLSGGRVIRNKKAWFAHYWRKSKDRQYDLKRNTQHRPAEIYLTYYFMNNLWPGQVRTIDWLIAKFKPPGWPENWREEKIQWEKEHPGIYG